MGRRRQLGRPYVVGGGWSSPPPFWAHRAHFDNGSTSDVLWNLPLEATRHRMWCGQGFDASMIRQYTSVSSGIKSILYKNAIFVDATNPAGGTGPTNPSGVSAAQVVANPDWVLHDSFGAIVTSTLDSNFQMMDPAHVGYQNAWATNAIAQCQRDGWNGVFIDDCNMDVFNVDGANRPAAYPTAESFQVAMRSFLANVGAQLASAGLLALPNIGGQSASIREAPLQDWLTLVDGCMDEGWMRSFVDPTQDLASVANGHWTADLHNALAAEAANKYYIAMTCTNGADSQAISYGLATAMLAFSSRIMCDISGNDAPNSQYSQEQWSNDMQTILALGAPSAGYLPSGPTVTNLFTNPSAENISGGIPVGFTKQAGSAPWDGNPDGGVSFTQSTGTISADTTAGQVYDDTYSLLWQPVNLVDGYEGWGRQVGAPAGGSWLGGHTYRFACYAKNVNSGGGRDSQLFMGIPNGDHAFRDASLAGGSLAPGFGIQDNYDDNGLRIFTRLDMSWTPAGDIAGPIWVGYREHGTITGQPVNFDSFIVWEGAAGWAWGDGDLPGNSWTGTPDNSTSLVINPQFYYRQFANGFVVANPFAAVASVDLSTIGGGAHTFSGSGFSHVSAFTLPSLHGALLLQVS